MNSSIWHCYSNGNNFVQAIQWTGNNLKEIIDVIGRHESLAHLPFEHYEGVVLVQGLRISLSGATGFLPVEVGCYIVLFSENGAQYRGIYTQAAFESTFVLFEQMLMPAT